MKSSDQHILTIYVMPLCIVLLRHPMNQYVYLKVIRIHAPEWYIYSNNFIYMQICVYNFCICNGFRALHIKFLHIYARSAMSLPWWWHMLSQRFWNGGEEFWNGGEVFKMEEMFLIWKGRFPNGGEGFEMEEKVLKCRGGFWNGGEGFQMEGRFWLEGKFWNGGEVLKWRRNHFEL